MKPQVTSNLSRRLEKYLPLFLITLLAVFFILLYFLDNKYKTPPPYGKDGVISINESDLNRGQPLFLIDGWLLTDERADKLPTYIGEYPNLQRGDTQVSPHGKAVYQITIRYSGEPVEVMINFSQLFFRHTVMLNGHSLSQGSGGTRISFRLSEGEHLLTVETESSKGYYSGMYHPPALGKPQLILHTILIRCIAYGIACFAVLALTLFTLILWHQSKEPVIFWFGLLCCSFALYTSYYFVRLLSLPIGEYWFLIQSLSFYWLCFCVIKLSALINDCNYHKFSLFIQRILIISSALLFLLSFLIPIVPQVVWIHSVITDFYYSFAFGSVMLITYHGLSKPDWESRLTRLACITFGTGLIYNLLASDLFEPILFFWQFEWCGVFLVILFSAMMASRNKRILAENAAFQYHLEELVEKRTEELTHLLQERKAFFADMAHDLKAPMFAAGSFIQAIKEHNTGVDDELLHYIDLVEQKRQETVRRVQGLTVFNQMDELSEACKAISVHTLMKEVYEAHCMAAEVQSVFLITELPDRDANLYAQPGKLQILFENLIVNALQVTPENGTITLSAQIDEEGCHLSISDTGCGILPEELPRIFNRFFTGSQSSGNSSGLGLYIVKNIVTALHGEISVSSKPGKGTTFFIDLPLMEAQ